MGRIYDENYGVEEERRSRRTKRILLGCLTAVLVAGVGYLSYISFFRTWSEERTVKQFLATLQSKDFQGAYRMFGCSQEKPCPNYDPQRFNRDWGPDTPYSQASNATIANVDFCGDGVVVLVNYPKVEPVYLWVDRSSNVISFFPYPQCPGRHWEFKRFFSSLFSSK